MYIYPSIFMIFRLLWKPPAIQVLGFLPCCFIPFTSISFSVFHSVHLQELTNGWNAIDLSSQWREKKIKKKSGYYSLYVYDLFKREHRDIRGKKKSEIWDFLPPQNWIFSAKFISFIMCRAELQEKRVFLSWHPWYLQLWWTEVLACTIKQSPMEFAFMQSLVK